MHLLLTGICGFVGSTLAKALIAEPWVSSIVGIDNFSRAGSELNRLPLRDLGIRIIAGDIRCQSDIDSLPKCDYVIDAAANPSVLAGVDGKTSSRQLIEHNLAGTINILEYCKRHQAGFVLLSTSRVYSIPGLANLKMKVVNDAFVPDPNQQFPDGITVNGVSEAYSTHPPVSLYGSTKVTSEHLALEYGSTFDFPVWVNRCGVMAGAGQFGHPAQGIFAYWIHSFREGKPLKYIGFGGHGHQVRDCLHPRDLVPLLNSQLSALSPSPSASRPSLPAPRPRLYNLSGGIASSMSLAQLTAWCTQRYPNSPTINSLPSALSPSPSAHSSPSSRPFDIPWMVLDETHSTRSWDWHPETSAVQILYEIAVFADQNPDWLKECST
ncbi:MAG TPA: CDP-tyvelose epimerase [Planctomycetaceae bacterium]|nr:CDP-tyvelose epimerase [Planctomycetaceae bacterium]